MTAPQRSTATLLFRSARAASKSPTQSIDLPENDPFVRVLRNNYRFRMMPVDSATVSDLAEMHRSIIERSIALRRADTAEVPSARVRAQNIVSALWRSSVALANHGLIWELSDPVEILDTINLRRARSQMLRDGATAGGATACVGQCRQLRRAFPSIFATSISDGAHAANPVVTTRHEAVKLLHLAQTMRRHPRERTVRLIALSAGAGLGVKDLCSLAASDVNAIPGRTTIRIDRAGSARTVTLASEFDHVLRDVSTSSRQSALTGGPLPINRQQIYHAARAFKVHLAALNRHHNFSISSLVNGWVLDLLRTQPLPIVAALSGRKTSSLAQLAELITIPPTDRISTQASGETWGSAK